MDTTFNCPTCGAPGDVLCGLARYSCTCRLNSLRYSLPPKMLINPLPFETRKFPAIKRKPKKRAK